MKQMIYNKERSENIGRSKEWLRNIRSFLLLILLLFVILAANICVGSVNVPLSEVWNILRGLAGNEVYRDIVMQIRLPRALAAIVIGGALSYKDILFMVNLTNGAVQRQVLRAKGVNEDEIMARIQPVTLDAHNIGNAPTSYAYYLGNMILIGILAMSILLVVSYSLASELKYGTSKDLLALADDSIDITITGKLIPYTLLFTTLGVMVQLLLFGPLHFPLKGSIWAMVISTLLLVMAYEAIAVFVVSMVPTLRLAVCISALYSVLGFSLAGFTLPIESLPVALQGVSWLYPLRFYYKFYVQEAIFGMGFAGWWTSCVSMLVFLLIPFVGRKRLYDAYKYQLYPRN